ncbi:Anaphase-Promoting Complex/Cyclosome (APC/C) largest subunit, putative [Candida dubliniensis CD36]|uniref:Anaphase-Promoting Complex/Cyclosome (APC/C) largest subunit, putative n=1 Tax=Candida dubliniensis (strain CD36 / ATCC MYA-646 / CBS 7987 / NCPF 3949 / NRRL Y-17841) TaxID=573826 RepID=B9W6L1_CANDC|nr:Anaphase-Promoting Complex/Cyclosome (APC/C) largest subunit, putative [Candida dubliniensis CD36]CAX44316.1 Anaphase-Promoting Complex/Cyclosome (APC/C) largest subunit, putative [Candida dubliniensis CD36]
MTSSPDNALLKFPIFGIQEDTDYPVPFQDPYKLALFRQNKRLLIAKRKLAVVKGSIITKILTYEEDIVTATYTHFSNSQELEEVLVVSLKKHIHVYYADGKSYVCSLPFALKNALPFESGLVLQRDQNESLIPHNGALYSNTSHLNSATILTLVDPMGDFRIVATASTSVISSKEEVITFPRKDMNKVCSLCVTFNASDGSISIYHVKAPSRTTTFGKTQSARNQKRRYGSITTPNPSRILEEDNGPEPLHSISLNMEKKRTSTLLSDISSVGRVSSDCHSLSQDFSGFKKDMILSRVETFGSRLQKDQLRIFNIWFEDQEGVVVFNRIKRECAVLIYRNPSFSRHSSVFKTPCLDCITLNSAKYEGNLVLLTEDQKFLIVNPFLGMKSTSHTFASKFKVCSLIDSYDSNLALKLSDGSNVIIKMVLEPSSELVKMCLSCFQYLSGSNINHIMWMLWRSAYLEVKYADEWKAFVIALLSLIFPFKEGVQCVENEITKLLPVAKRVHETSNVNYNLHDLIPYITISLHLVREEIRLDSTKAKCLTNMNLLLCQLTTWMGWPAPWVKYYSIKPACIDPSTRFLSALILETPPNLLRSLASLFTNNIVRYLTFSQLVEETETVDLLVTPRTYYVLKLFEVLVSSQYGPSAIVSLMLEFGITKDLLETYPLGISIPLKEALSTCQESPEFEWTSQTLDLVGRKDLNKLLSDVDFSADINTDSHTSTQDLSSLLNEVLEDNENFSPWDGQSEAERMNITKLIFEADRRYFEITTLLHQTKTQTAYLKVDENVSEYDLVLQQRDLAVIVALRTLTIPLGRAALVYASRRPLLTEKFPIPKFNLNTLILPTMTNIVYSEDRVSKSFSEWGHFHNGVSSGLSIGPFAKGISGSWIIFNKPPELNSQHAGFLLGLGLNGHLKRLEEWHIYNYLGPKHPLTSIGLLIGMAASLRGTMDNKLTKVLSVHAVALLPQGANDLNVPTMVQTAGLIGIGLLYLESQHRRMSEVLLSQITASVLQNDTEQVHEGYRLAAGIALGFVNLGKGDDLRGLNDTHVIDKLMALAIAMKDYQPVQESGKSCCGAIIALAFIYLQTENSNVANKLKLPDTEQMLDYIRPDLLFLRCLAKNLIMWNDISCTDTWITTQMPSSVAQKYMWGNESGFEHLDGDQLTYFNVLGGACLSMALKFASSHNLEARDTVLKYLDKVMELSSKPALNYDQKIAYKGCINLQNILALCASIIMAASGDLEVFRRLRVLHNDTNKKMGFGCFMAINTALGFLFLGGGQYAFDSSPFAIACLVTSLYPIYPTENSEYEIHLQALRHFWALAIQPRCLIVRDISTGRPCKIPISINMKNGSVIESISPCLLPDINDILTLKTNSSAHFEVVLDFSLNSEVLEKFMQSLTLYVEKSNNYTVLKPNVRSILSNYSRRVKPDEDTTNFSSLQLLGNLEENARAAWYHENTNHVESDLCSSSVRSGLSLFNIIDNQLELINNAQTPKSVEDIWNLKLLFEYANDIARNNKLNYISLEFIEGLRHKLWRVRN